LRGACGERPEAPQGSIPCEESEGSVMPTGVYERPTIAVRFWSKVDKTGDCWEWTAARTNGYGVFRIGGRKDGRLVPAHRHAYEELVGPIPNGLQIDHLCRNPACVNPSHLEPVTQKENILRGESWPARNAAKDSCPRCGDEFSVQVGGRYCRRCRNKKAAERMRQGRSA
jgi:hypothetical protein